MENQVPTQEEFSNWKADPVTQQYHNLLRRYQADLMEQWRDGVFQISEKPSATVAANAEALGQIRLLTNLIELTYEQFGESFSEDDSQQSQSA